MSPSPSRGVPSVPLPPGLSSSSRSMTRTTSEVYEQVSKFRYQQQGVRPQQEEAREFKVYKDISRVCVGESLSIESIRPLLEACAEAIRAHGNGDTFLHYACSNDKVTLEVVQYLVDLDPAAVEHESVDEWLPLHRACLNENAPSEVIRYLIELYPAALQVQCPGRELPLYSLIKERQSSLDLALVEYAIGAYPAALMVESSFGGGLPLHEVCRRNDVSLDLVRLVAEKEPTAISTRGGYADVPPIFSLFLPNSGCSNHTRLPPLDVVRYLAEQAPATLDVKNHKGENPFHLACRTRNVSLEMIKLFVEIREDLLQVPFGYFFAGNLPLHQHCGSDSVSLEIVKYLVEGYPQAVQVANNKGLLPLSCSFGKSLEVTQYLVEQYPDGIRSQGFDGQLPLHRSLRHGGGIEEIQYVYGLFPEAICTRDHRRDLPLHVASQYQNLEVNHFLIREYPQAARETGANRDLPLHRACCSRWTTSSRDGAGRTQYLQLSLIQLLLDEYPEAIHTENKAGCLPLHCAVRKDVFMHLLIVRYMDYFRRRGDFPLHALLDDCQITSKTLLARRFVEFFGFHARNANREGALPLHLAVATSLDPEFIDELIDDYPEAVATRDYQGALPLHYALRHQSSIDVVTRLVDRRPGSVRVADDLGSIPIHVACDRGASLEVVKKLVETDEETMAMADPNGDLGLHKACRVGHLSLVKLLMERHGAAIRVPNSSGMLPVFLLSQPLGKSRECLETTEYVETIWELLRNHPEAAKEIPDQKGAEMLQALKQQKAAQGSVAQGSVAQGSVAQGSVDKGSVAQGSVAGSVTTGVAQFPTTVGAAPRGRDPRAVPLPPADDDTTTVDASPRIRVYAFAPWGGDPRTVPLPPADDDGL